MGRCNLIASYNHTKSMKVKDVLKKTGIVTAHVDDSLSSAVSKLHSSHDACFVFDGEAGSKYVGVINPYYSLIKHQKYQGESLVRHCLFHPPKVSMDDSIERVVGLMMESRMHYLPVIDQNGRFKGVVSARRILKQMAADPVFQITVTDALKEHSKPLVSVYADDKVSTVINLFETEQVSKLVVIDHDMKLQGIFSYYDLIPHLIAPRDKQDYARENSNEHDPYVHMKVRNVMQQRVHMRKPDVTLSECLTDMVTREIGSVVIVNRQGFPAGIITIHDLLRRLKHDEPRGFIELSTNDVSPANMEIIQDYGPKLERWVAKMKDVVRCHMLVKEEKNGGLFKVTMHIIPRKGKAIVYSEEGKKLVDVLKKINKNN